MVTMQYRIRDETILDMKHVEEVWKDKLTKLHGLVANLKPGVDNTAEVNALREEVRALRQTASIDLRIIDDNLKTALRHTD